MAICQQAIPLTTTTTTSFCGRLVGAVVVWGPHAQTVPIWFGQEQLRAVPAVHWSVSRAGDGCSGPGRWRVVLPVFVY